MIFDDILVNFDPDRAAAASADVELSRNQQILLFTCHPATVDLLEKNGFRRLRLRTSDGTFSRTHRLYQGQKTLSLLLVLAALLERNRHDFSGFSRGSRRESAEGVQTAADFAMIRSRGAKRQADQPSAGPIRLQRDIPQGDRRTMAMRRGLLAVSKPVLDNGFPRH